MIVIRCICIIISSPRRTFSYRFYSYFYESLQFIRKCICNSLQFFSITYCRNYRVSLRCIQFDIREETSQKQLISESCYKGKFIQKTLISSDTIDCGKDTSSPCNILKPYWRIDMVVTPLVNAASAILNEKKTLGICCEAFVKYFLRYNS